MNEDEEDFSDDKDRINRLIDKEIKREDEYKIVTDTDTQNAFFEALRTDNASLAMEIYEDKYAKLRMREQALFFRKALEIADGSMCTNLLYFVLSVFPGWQIRQIIRFVDEATSQKYRDSVDFSKLFRILEENKEFEKLGIIQAQWQVIDSEKLTVEDLRAPAYLNSCRTPDDAVVFFREYIDHEDELEAFLKINDSISSMEFANACIAQLLQNEDKQEYCDVLRAYFRIKHSLGNNVYLSIDQIVDLARAIPFDTLKAVFEDCTKDMYKYKINRRYAQREIRSKDESILKKVIKADISTTQKVFLYMNSKLRKTINLDYFVDTMLRAGMDADLVLDCLMDYWIVGTIKYVQEDGWVRIAPGSVSCSRLMVFQSKQIKINGENGWEDPKEGMIIYYKLRSYKEGGQFRVHYPCTDINYSQYDSERFYE